MSDYNPGHAPAFPPAGQPGGTPGQTHDTSPPIFEGHVSIWMGFWTFVMSAILALGGAAAALYGISDRQNSLGRPLMIAGLALFLASALMPIYVILRIRAQRYVITRRLIEREQGLLIRNVDSIDLAKVKDVELTQSFLERVMNIGTIKVYSTDRTIPTLLIEAIPDARPVYEQLRDAVIDVGRQRGIVSLDR